jgi:predicted HTH domain antitoxin
MELLEYKETNDKSNLKALVDLGIYKSEEEFIHDALKNLLQNKEIRLKLALHRYQTDEISIGKAAEIAGLCWEDMRDELMKNGIKPRLVPETIEEAKEDYLAAKRIYNELNRK